MSLKAQLKSQATTSAAIPTQHTSAEQSSNALSASDALCMQVSLTNPVESNQPDLPALPTHVVRLSQNGLRFNHSEKLDHSQQIWLHIRLGQQVIVTEATVIDSDGKKDHLGKTCFDTQVHFTDTTSDFQSMVRTHIEDVVAKIFRNRREYNLSLIHI